MTSADPGRTFCTPDKPSNPPHFSLRSFTFIRIYKQISRHSSVFLRFLCRSCVVDYEQLFQVGLTSESGKEGKGVHCLENAKTVCSCSPTSSHAVGRYELPLCSFASLPNYQTSHDTSCSRSIPITSINCLADTAIFHTSDLQTFRPSDPQSLIETSPPHWQRTRSLPSPHN